MPFVIIVFKYNIKVKNSLNLFRRSILVNHLMQEMNFSQIVEMTRLIQIPFEKKNFKNLSLL